MPTALKPQAISGVSPNREAEIHTVFPSISSTSFGRGLGQLFDCLPMPIWGIKLSHLIFPLPLAPVALLGFLWLKVFGTKYVVTNRSVQIRGVLTNRRITTVLLGDIAQVQIRQELGQAFYPAGDLYLLNKSGESLAVLSGVLWPEGLQQIIQKARTAQSQVDASLAVIKSRQK